MAAAPLRQKNFYEPLEAIRENGGWGIPTLKPWAVEVVKERLKEVEAVHPLAFAMDIDSAGLPHAGLANPPMLLKTEEELRDCCGNQFAVYRKGHYDGGSGAEGGQSRCVCDCGFQPWRQSDGSWAFDSRGAA